MSKSLRHVSPTMDAKMRDRAKVHNSDANLDLRLPQPAMYLQIKILDTSNAYGGIAMEHQSLVPLKSTAEVTVPRPPAFERRDASTKKWLGQGAHQCAHRSKIHVIIHDDRGIMLDSRTDSMRDRYTIAADA